MERTRTASSNAKTGGAILTAPILSQSFQIGSFSIRYYSLTFVAAIVSAYLIGRARAVRDGIRAEVFDDIAFWTVLVGFISARIYYVLFYWPQFQNNLSEIYKVWHGGIAIYGALIGGAAGLYFACKKHKIRFWHMTDIIVLGLPIAQAIGRLGNYFNYEAFGLPTNLPWKMYVPPQFRPAGYAQYQYFHPAFAYEIIWNLLVFVLLWVLGKRFHKRGLLTGTYFMLYSYGRFVIEGIRLDSAYFGSLRGDQITALLLIILGLGIIISRYVPQTHK